MKPLFDNQLAPTTYTTGFVECAFATVVDQALAWDRSIFADVKDTALEQPLRASLSALRPLVAVPNQRLLVETRSSWVATFDNGQRGSDPAGFVGHMCGVLKCRGLVTTWRPAAPDNADNPQSMAVRFVSYVPDDEGESSHVERSISLVNDYGEWTFRQSGAVLPFEEPDRYDAKRDVDRFTPEALATYCARLGIRWLDDDFYGPVARVIETGKALPAGALPESLARVRRELLGLD